MVRSVPVWANLRNGLTQGRPIWIGLGSRQAAWRQPPSAYLATRRHAARTAGRELADIARDWGVGIETAVARLQPAGGDLLDNGRSRCAPRAAGFDGLPHDVHQHSRLWGTVPRVLGHYCREVGLFSLERAVRKGSGSAN